MTVRAASFARTASIAGCLPRIAAVLAAMLLADSSLAVEMYRWKDKVGRTHVSDVVPPEYRSTATRIDSRSFEVSEERRRAAVAQAEQAKRLAVPMPASAASASAARFDLGRISEGSAKRSPPPTEQANDCATRHRQFHEAQACFAPCKTAYGAVKAECFSRCPVLVDPSPQCGLSTLR